MKTICVALTILFVALKLTGAIAWSWLWVLAPVWIPFVAVAGLYAGIAVIMLVAAIIGLGVLCIAAITDAVREWRQC